MARTLDELVVRVAADTSKMRAELRAGLRELNNFKGQSAGALAGIDKAFLSLRGLAGGLGLATSVVSLVAFAKSAIESAAALGEQAEQLGVSAQALQTYQFAATQTGVKSQELESSLARLTASLGEAAQDGSGPAAQAFRRLGVDLAAVNAAANPTEAALRAIAEAARKSGADARFAADAKDVLGRAAQRLIPMLKGGEAGFEEFGRQASRVSDATIARFDALGDKIAAAMKRAGVATAEFLGAVIPDLRDFVPLVEQLAVAETGLRDARDAGGIQKFLMPHLEPELQREVARLRERMREVTRGTALTGLSRTPAEPPETAEQRKALDDIDKGWVAFAEARLAEDERVATEERKLLEARVADNLAAAEAINKGWVEFAEASVRASDEEAAAAAKLLSAKADANRASEQEIADNERRIAALKISTEAYAQVNTEIELNNRLRGDALSLSPEELEANRRLAETIGTQRDQIDKLKEATARSKDFARDLGLTFTSAFEDAIVGGKKFSDVLKGLEQDIIRVIARKAITEPLGNFIATGIGGLGKLLGFAEGGSPPVGVPSVVGERGPELFVPRVPGTIVPNHRLNAGGGGMSVTINQFISISPDVSAQARAEIRAQLPAIRRYAMDGVFEARLRGMAPA